MVCSREFCTYYNKRAEVGAKMFEKVSILSVLISNSLDAI